MDENYAIELKGITKRFGNVVANNKVNLNVKKHEILSILGENGSGKTTLMNMIAGIYRPDEGEIFINGKKTQILSPKDANAFHIGMVHQHYKLVNIFTAAENIILGAEKNELRPLDMKAVKEKIEKICDAYGFKIDLDQKIYNMSVSQKQTVEIVKVLYKGADILILDEPTAVLTPQETKSLFEVMHNMKKAGKSIIIITHKLNEVLENTDRVTVLRKGEYIGTVNTADATVSSLTEMMVGESVSLDITRSEPKDDGVALKVIGLNYTSKDGVRVLNNVDFSVRRGEILGIAGIAGCGVKELFEIIAGIHEMEDGCIRFFKKDGSMVDISNMSPDEIKKAGANISFVPEDRIGMGLVGSMGMTDNIMLKTYKNTKGIFLKRKLARDLAKKIKDDLAVATPGIEYPVRRLSGGNVQKVLVGREISSNPDILMLAYPVRGLDINSSYAIYNQLTLQKEKGVAVISVFEDLDVLLQLCDRILVLNSGRITGIEDARTTTKEKIGYLMTA